MEEREAAKARVRDLAARAWDVLGIEARYRRLVLEGISPRRLVPAAVVAAKNAILDRAQRRAEEYEYLSHN